MKMVTELSGNVCLSDCDKCRAVPHDEIENCRQRNLVKLCRQDIKDLRGLGKLLTDTVGHVQEVESRLVAQTDQLIMLRDRLNGGEIGKAMHDGLNGSKPK